MESLMAQIQGLSAIPEEHSNLLTILKNAESFLHSESSRLAPFLSQLHPAHHTLGFLHLLEAHTSGPVTKEKASEFVPSIITFINECLAEHIHLYPDKFLSVCKRLKEQVILLETPIRGIAPILTAIRKLQSSSDQLTALHPEFLLLCIMAKCYRTGMCILDEDVFEVDHPRDFLLYCYYGGVVCIGQKHFQKALEFFHNVVTAPMTALNAIAIEAFKKYLLVSIIQNGQFSTSFPKYTSVVAQRNLKNFTQIYLDLANSYNNGKLSELETFVDTNREIFNVDNNLGLVKQVISSIYKRNIQRLTQTYLTLSLKDIARIVGLNSPKQAELRVLQMIEEGEIHATINQKDGMVKFLEDPEQYNTNQMILHIDSSIQRVMALSKKLADFDEALSCDPLYLSKVGRQSQRFDFDDFDAVPQRFTA